MITLREITLENRRAIFNLEVEEEQRRFVASNLSSVASCYVLATNGGQPFPFAIYTDELPSIADDSHCILRLMIDQKYQGRGYGRKAMAEFWHLYVPSLQDLHVIVGFLTAPIIHTLKSSMKALASVIMVKFAIMSQSWFCRFNDYILKQCGQFVLFLIT